jgi:hypothetical protein
MAFQQMYRVSVAWTNWSGAPGVSQMFLTGANIPTQANIDAIRTFFGAFTAYLPSGLTINVPSSGDNMNAVDGKIVGSWSVGTPPAAVTGSGTGAYAGNAGAVIHWLTSDVVNGRRVRGRTFLVPLINVAYEANGSLAPGFITAATNAANAYVSSNAGAAGVWARPFTHKTDPTKNREGSVHSATSIRVPDLAVSMRSRRV